MRYVYILRSNSCPWRHYVGVTLDPDRRLIAHNAGMSPHTSKYRPWSIIVVIRFEDDARAFEIEKYLKSPYRRVGHQPIIRMKCGPVRFASLSPPGYTAGMGV